MAKMYFFYTVTIFSAKALSIHRIYFLSNVFVSLLRDCCVEQNLCCYHSICLCDRMTSHEFVAVNSSDWELGKRS